MKYTMLSFLKLGFFALVLTIRTEASADILDEWLDATLGISLEEFARTHPHATAGSGIDRRPIDSKKLDQDLQVIAGNYGEASPSQPLHLVGKIYRFRGGRLQGIMVTFTSDKSLFEGMRVRILEACLSRFGKDFTTAVTRQSLGQVELLLPMFVWQRPTEKVRLTMTVETEYAKLVEGVLVLAVQSSKGGEAFAQSFPEVAVSPVIQQHLLNAVSKAVK